MYKNHGNGKSNILRLDRKFRVQTKYVDGTEKVEEWSSDMNDTSIVTNRREKCQELKLISRKWKTPTGLNNNPFATCDNSWEYEIGEVTKHNTTDNNNTYTSASAQAGSRQNQLMTLNSKCPTWHMDATKDLLLFKVRNCPWPLENYEAVIDDNTQEIILRTKNKKFFKRFKIPALSRLNERPCKTLISLSHANDELVLSYIKPKLLLNIENKEKKELEKAISGLDKDDVECKQS